MQDPCTPNDFGRFSGELGELFVCQLPLSALFSPAFALGFGCSGFQCHLVKRLRIRGCAMVYVRQPADRLTWRADPVGQMPTTIYVLFYCCPVLQGRDQFHSGCNHCR